MRLRCVVDIVRRHHTVANVALGSRARCSYVCAQILTRDPDAWVSLGRHGHARACMQRVPCHSCFASFDALVAFCFNGSLHVMHAHARNLRAASPCLHPHAGVLTRAHACHSTCMPSGRRRGAPEDKTRLTLQGHHSTCSSYAPGPQASRAAQGGLLPTLASRRLVHQRAFWSVWSRGDWPPVCFLVCAVTWWLAPSCSSEPALSKLPLPAQAPCGACFPCFALLPRGTSVVRMYGPGGSLSTP